MTGSLPQSADIMPPADDPIAVQRSKARMLAVVNQKGGVGKTTTAVNMGTAMAAAGRRVLLIDMDPQGNASTSVGIGREARSVSVYEVLLGHASLTEAVLTSDVKNLDVIPSRRDLVGADVELVSLERGQFRLRDALKAHLTGYDYVIIDCPPSLTPLTVNALTAVDRVLVPVQCEFLALEGIGHLIKTIEHVRATLNPSLSIHGVVLTMFDRRSNLSAQVADDVRQFFGAKVFDTVIPRNVRVSEAPSHGRPVLLYDWRCPGSQAYIHLAGEMLRRDAEVAA